MIFKRPIVQLCYLGSRKSLLENFRFWNFWKLTRGTGQLWITFRHSSMIAAWWTRGVSNPLPRPCHGRALPIELRAPSATSYQNHPQNEKGSGPEPFLAFAILAGYMRQ